MANCPNCGVKLRFADWKPNCPECGVNLNYYNANERLLDDSEKAEIEHALFQPRVDRAKAAYAGSKLAILRIVFTLLPVGALFLPLCSLTDARPSNVNVIGLYKYISSVGIDKVLTGGVSGVSAALFFLSAAMILVCIISLIASLGKHGKGRTSALYGIMACAAFGSAVCFLIYGAGKDLPAGEIVPTMLVGGYLYLVLQFFSCFWNALVLKKGISVKYTPCVIGGLPSEEYFKCVDAGWTKSQIRRKMLVALTKMQIDAAKDNAEEEEARV